MIKTPIPPNVPMIPNIKTQILNTVVAVDDSQSGQIGVHWLLKSSQKKFSLHVMLHSLLLLEFEGRISVRIDSIIVNKLYIYPRKLTSVPT